MTTSWQIVLAALAVAFVLVRRMQGEPAQGRRLLVLPGVLVVIGSIGLPASFEDPVSTVFLVVGVVLGLVLGAARAVTVDLAERDGVAFLRYTRTTAALWLLSALVKVVEMVAHSLVAPGHDSGDSLMVTLGLGLLAEGLVVLQRANRAGHPLSWTRRSRPTSPSRSTRSPASRRVPAPSSPTSSLHEARRERRRQRRAAMSADRLPSPRPIGAG